MKVDFKKCTACFACYNSCPQRCIEMKYDREGFLFPFVQEEKCNSCGLCERNCPLNKVEKLVSYKTKAYACYARKDEDRSMSMTGGICYLLGKFIIENKGIVFGAVGKITDRVYHQKAYIMEELELFRGSKYLQSEIGSAFKDVKQELEQGKKVLFTGTGCQIAGLNSYLGKEYSNLFTIDLICHGVPSKVVLDAYLGELGEKYNSKVVDAFRDKAVGWCPSHFTYVFENGKKITFSGETNNYNRGYTSNMFQRNSCYTCSYAKRSRKADITVGDYFSKEKIKAYDSTNEGLSLVTINTKKGEEFFGKIEKSIYLWEVPLEEAIKESEHLAFPPKKNVYRRTFFYLLKKKNFEYTAKLLLPITKLGKNVRRIYGIVCLVLEKTYFRGR